MGLTVKALFFSFMAKSQLFNPFPLSLWNYILFVEKLKNKTGHIFSLSCQRPCKTFFSSLEKEKNISGTRRGLLSIISIALRNLEKSYIRLWHNRWGQSHTTTHWNRPVFRAYKLLKLIRRQVAPPVFFSWYTLPSICYRNSQEGALWAPSCSSPHVCNWV